MGLTYFLTQLIRAILTLLILGLFSCESDSSTEQSPRVVLRDGDIFLVQDSLLIPTPDGAQISAIVVQPKEAPDPLPALLFHTIYRRDQDIDRAFEAAQRGYIGVVSYTRGKHLSPDSIQPYQFEGQDVYTVIDWISKQDWNSNQVGMYGGSYVGYVQWASMKDKVHPALKTIVPSVAAAPGIAEPMENGVYFNFHYPWWHYVGNSKALDTTSYFRGNYWRNLYVDWYEKGLAYTELEQLDEQPNPGFRQSLAHPTFDSYWKELSLYKEDFAKVNIPVLSTTGYYDGGQFGTLHYLKSHYQYHRNPEHYLLIGPYSHFGAQELPEPTLLGYDIDPVAQINIKHIIFDWFDYIFKGAPKPALLKDKINYQVMGSNQWKHAPSIAEMSQGVKRFYLSSVRSGVTFKSTYNTGNDGQNEHFSLSDSPESNRYIEQEIDLADRSPFSWNLSGGGTIISEHLTVGKGYSFISEPFDKDMELSGALTGQLNIAINKKDFDLNVLLYEQTEDGSFFSLTLPYVMRASMAGGIEKRSLLEPHKKTAIEIKNFRLTSKKISKGSRIVILVNGIKGPFNQINYGTGKEVRQESIEDAEEPLLIRWYDDSFIELPIH